MGALTGQTIAASYEQLLHVDTDGGGNTATLVPVKDGDNGTTFALQMSTTKVMVAGSGNKLYFGDEGGEWISGDTSHLTITAGGNLDLNCGATEMVTIMDPDATPDDMGWLMVKSDDNHVALSIRESTGTAMWAFGVYSGSGIRDQSLLIYNSNKDTPTMMIQENNGRVVMGETAIENDRNTSLGAELLIEGPDDSSSFIAIESHDNDTANNSSYLSLRRARGTASSPSIVAVNDRIGMISWAGYVGSNGDSVNHDTGAAIVVRVHDVAGDGSIAPSDAVQDLATEMFLQTQADGSGTGLTSGITIDSVQNVGIGTTNPYGGVCHVKSTVSNEYSLTVEHNHGSLPKGIRVDYSGGSPDGTGNSFIYCEDSTQTKFIVASNGNVTSRTDSYEGISDRRMKENIVDCTPKLEDLLKVKVRNYNFRERDEETNQIIGSDDEEKYIGVIAQELETVFPGLVGECVVKEARPARKATPAILREDGGIDKDAIEAQEEVAELKRHSVKYSLFVPMLIKAVQELSAKVTALENA